MRRAVLFVLLLLRVAQAAPPSGLDAIRDSGGAGFERAIEPRAFEFPADHGPHPGFRHEWWYLTGNLDSAAGERFGFELTFFRLGLAPGPRRSEARSAGDHGVGDHGVDDHGVGDDRDTGESAWRSSELYAAHFAVTDVSRGTFRYWQKASREALGLAGARVAPLRVWIDDWSLQDTQLHARGSDYELTLELPPWPRPVLNGDRGLSRKSDEPGAASYYYSIGRLAVKGRLVRDGAPIDVTGLAWLDREWGSGSLGADQQGWDWFALQLDDGTSWMFYSLRNDSGATDPHSAGTRTERDGRASPLGPDSVRISVTGTWTSPKGGRYPAAWTIHDASGLDLNVRPVMAAQELDTRPRYWEGAVDVKGTRLGKPVAGRGYVELVGYAR